MKHYTVQINSNNNWNNILSATAVKISFAKGFVAGMRLFYPCPALRIVEYKTGIVIEEFAKTNSVSI